MHAYPLWATHTLPPSWPTAIASPTPMFENTSPNYTAPPHDPTWVEMAMQVLESGFNSVLPVNKVLPLLSVLLNCLQLKELKGPQSVRESKLTFE